VFFSRQVGVVDGRVIFRIGRIWSQIY
jgi:hypothetical protein